MSVPVPRRTGAFTVEEVQLVLLRRMADLQAGLVDRALREAGWSKAQMREANRRWNAVEFGRPGPLRHSRFTRALGSPMVDHRPAPLPVTAFRSCWPLPLWPGLWLQVLVDDQDVVHHFGLARADGVPPPRLRSAGDAVPWRCTLAECAAAFTGVTFHDVGLTGHEAITCSAPGPDGTPTRWLMRSIWGLLQRVDPSNPGGAVGHEVLADGTGRSVPGAGHGQRKDVTVEVEYIAHLLTPGSSPDRVE